MKCKEKFLVFEEYLAKGKCLNCAGRQKSRWSRAKESFAQNATRRSDRVSGYEIRILAMPEANGLRKRLFIKDKCCAY